MKNSSTDRGAAAVELALLLPLLLLLVLGIIDFGRALNAQITLTQAVREGARVAALKQPDVVGRTQNAATGLSGVTVTVTPCPATPAANTSTTVKATYTFTFVTPVGGIASLFGGASFGDPITLTARGVMPCEA